MKFHIVRNQETTKEILNIYSLTISELKEANRHVRDWNKLIPGTKIKIPIINEATEQDIIDMEPFIEDYYPRNEEPIFQNDNQSFVEQSNQDFSDDFSSGDNDHKKEIEEDNNQVNNDSNAIEVSKEETNTKTIEEEINLKSIQKDINEINIRENELSNKQRLNNPHHQGVNVSYVWYQPYPVYYPIYIKIK